MIIEKWRSDLCRARNPACQHFIPHDAYGYGAHSAVRDSLPGAEGPELRGSSCPGCGPARRLDAAPACGMGTENPAAADAGFPVTHRSYPAGRPGETASGYGAHSAVRNVLRMRGPGTQGEQLSETRVCPPSGCGPRLRQGDTEKPAAADAGASVTHIIPHKSSWRDRSGHTRPAVRNSLRMQGPITS